MIVDCHTHIWEKPEQFAPAAVGYPASQQATEGISAHPADHALAGRCVDKTLVHGYVSRHLNTGIPNEFLADYVSRHGDKVIGIAAVDPTDPACCRTAEKLLDREEFRGLTISPPDQNFHPADSRAWPLYALAAERKVPIFFRLGPYFPKRATMAFARPVLLDEIAMEYPALTIVVGGLGMPWIPECLALLAKHSNVYADLAGVLQRPWTAYNALIQADQFAVTDKLLLASDFPFSTATEAVEGIYRLRELTQNTNLPSVPRETLRSVVERDALGCLGIARPNERPTTSETEQADIEDE